MSVQTWLESLGLAHINEALSSVGITTPTDLVMLHGSDLRTLAKGLKLDGMSELKLIVAVNKLQIKDTRVVVTPQEDEAMRKLSKRINETRNSLDVLQDLVQKTKLCAKKSRKSVNLEFDAFFEELKKRKAVLLDTVDKEEKVTLDTLEGQVRKLSDLLFQLREAKLECDKYLMISSVDSLDSRTKKVGEQVIEAVNLKPSETPKISAEIRYVSNAEKISKILRTHGKIAKGSLLAVLVIKSHEATRNEISFTLEDHQGIALKGEGDHKDQHEILEYCVSVSQSDQKQEEGAQEDIFEKLFEANTKTFKLSDLHQKTEYLVHIKAKNSIGWSQPSEPISIRTTAGPSQIQGVSTHSHRKHHSRYHPSCLLRSDNIYYSSATIEDFGSAEVDWIVFELKDFNQLEVIKIRNYPGDLGVKDMDIKCSQDLQNWSDVASITPNNTGNMQTFALVCSFQYVKLEFVNNHGRKTRNNNKFVVYEVQFWGH